MFVIGEAVGGQFYFRQDCDVISDVKHYSVILNYTCFFPALTQYSCTYVPIILLNINFL